MTIQRHNVTLTTGTGRQLIRCAGPNEAANLALTLQCDGWQATVDPFTYSWAHDPANFDSANVWAIRITTAAPSTK